MNTQMHVIGLTAAYAALCTLLLIVLIHISIPRLAKAGMIALMTAFCAGVFFFSQGMLGWAAASAVPERFQVLWTRVVEPNPSQQSSGAIYLWVEALDDHNLPSGEPRAFIVPYSAAMADKVSTAQTEIKKGNAQAGTRHAFTPTVGSGGGAPAGVNVRNVSQGAMAGGDPSGGGIFDPAALGGQSKAIDLIPLPPPLLPPKDGP
ncbi:hypothetical protein [Hyphomicrobium sp. NDB2Meth4]|uniref:hypothetical protein n=1 Tax=Hyphomicrobium sp. NDB2Meth4 TaxID=1892846 RepID=UPI0009301CE3|nr:hypothetical protein [Hyphomicrobium sp. NDB2Meth4]